MTMPFSWIYRAAEVRRLDTTDPVVRARIERQLRNLAEAADDPDWMVEPNTWTSRR